MDKAQRRKGLHDLAERLQSHIGTYEGKFSFPLEHIIACLRDDKLQSRHRLAEALERYQEKLTEPVENAVWFYFRSPTWTWEHDCGRGGWMVVDKEPPREIAFFLEVMN